MQVSFFCDFNKRAHLHIFGRSALFHDVAALADDHHAFHSAQNFKDILAGVDLAPRDRIARLVRQRRAFVGKMNDKCADIERGVPLAPLLQRLLYSFDVGRIRTTHHDLFKPPDAGRADAAAPAHRPYECARRLCRACRRPTAFLASTKPLRLPAAAPRDRAHSQPA